MADRIAWFGELLHWERFGRLGEAGYCLEARYGCRVFRLVKLGHAAARACRSIAGWHLDRHPDAGAADTPAFPDGAPGPFVGKSKAEAQRAAEAWLYGARADRGRDRTGPDLAEAVRAEATWLSPVGALVVRVNLPALRFDVHHDSGPVLGTVTPLFPRAPGMPLRWVAVHGEVQLPKTRSWTAAVHAAAIGTPA